MKNAAIDVLSLFPQTVRAVLDSSILRRAQVSGDLSLESSDLRFFARDAYKSVDEPPFGGGPGMVFRSNVLDEAMQAQLKCVGGDRQKLKVIYPSPRGIRVEQSVFAALATWLAATEGGRLCFVCGRYEGVDERFVDSWVDLELSLGDFVLTGGELPALAVVDGIVRLLPGVLGDELSAKDESFSSGLLEYPQYTKPREWKGAQVPAELLSGNHGQAAEWRLRQSILLTHAFRPDLIRRHDGRGLPTWARELLERLKNRMDLKREAPV